MNSDRNPDVNEIGSAGMLTRIKPGCAPGAVKHLPREASAPDRDLRPGGVFWLAAIRRHWWAISLFVIAGGAGAYFLSRQLTPMYESTSVVQVDFQQPVGIVGQDALRPMLSTDSDEFLGTQVKLIMSDNVLRPVADKYKLLDLEKQLKGLDAEEARRERRAPITLRRLHVSRQTGTMLLLISYRSPYPEISAAVANEIADNYVNRVFELRSRTSASLSRFMGSQLEEIKAKMDKSNQRLAEFEREMSIINPEQRTTVLSARLLQLSEEFTKAQGERMRKEASVNAAKTDGVEAAQISTQGEILGKIDEKRIAARQAFASIAANLGRNHPDYRKAKAEVDELDRQFEETGKNIDRRIGTDYSESLDREKMLESQIKEAKAEYDDANKHVFSYQQLKREADDDRVMYSELLRKVRESSINAGFQNQSIRVTDLGLPASKPVSPNIPFNVAVGMISTTLLYAGCLFAFSAADKTLRGARSTSEQLKVQVLGTLPAVSKLNKASLADRSRSMETLEAGTTSGRQMDLAMYGESVRKLRNALEVAVRLGDIRSVLITSAMPGDGKSMIASDLALSFARLQRTTLLIDADLRRPVIHERLELPNTTGLAEILAGTSTWRDSVRSSGSNPNLLVLTSGKANISPDEIVGPSFGHLLDELRDHFDLIVVDAPPMLPFSEPMRIAACVDGVVLVARSGKTTVEAAENVLSTLQWAGARVLGVILSQVPKSDESVTYYSTAYKAHK